MSTNSRMLHTRICWCVSVWAQKSSCCFPTKSKPTKLEKAPSFSTWGIRNISRLHTIQRLSGFWFHQTQHESLFSYKFQIIKLLWRSTVIYTFPIFGTKKHGKILEGWKNLWTTSNFLSAMRGSKGLFGNVSPRLCFHTTSPTPTKTYSFKPVILWRFCSKLPLKIHWISIHTNQ